MTRFLRGFFDAIAFVKTHTRNGGTIALPVYSNPAADNPKYPNGAIDERGTGASAQACAIVRLHAPFESLIVNWEALKEGAAPLVPNPYLFDTNHVFASGTVSASVPIDQMGGSGHFWLVAGTYHYHMIAPTDLNSDMQIGVTPWESQITVDQSVMPSRNFINTLLELVPNGYSPPLGNVIPKV